MAQQNTQNDQKYKLRNFEDSEGVQRHDGLGYAANALVTSVPTSREEKENDLVRANNLKLYKVIKRVDLDHMVDGKPAPRFMLITVQVNGHDAQGNDTEVGAKQEGKWIAFKEGVKVAVTPNAKPTTVNGQTYYDCPYYEYRKDMNKPLKVGDELEKPADPKYLRFSAPAKMKPFDCVVCEKDRVPTEEDPQPIQFATPSTVTTVEKRQEVSIAMRAKLPEFPQLATIGDGSTVNSTIYTAVNTPMLLGRMPGQPEIAARGKNPNATVQTVGDIVGGLLDIPLQAFPASIGGTSTIVVPFWAQSGRDTAARYMSEKQGSNGKAGNAQTAFGDPLIYAPNQWPFNGQWNPLAMNDGERRDATLLPGVGTKLDAKGNIQHADGTQFQNNHIYSGFSGIPSVTVSQVGVDSNFEKKNELVAGKPSAPVPLTGLNNYGMASMVDELSLKPQIRAASDALSTAIAGKDTAAAKLAAQQAIDLINYRSTLVGPSNYTVTSAAKINEIAALAPEAQVAAAKNLNRAEAIALQRATIIRAAEQAGVTGLKADNLPAEAPIRSVPKPQMRKQLTDYYTKLAEERSSAFSDLYAEQEMVGNKPSFDLKTKEGREAAADVFVDNLPFYVTYPENGAVLTEIDKVVSTRDPKHPTELSKNNFNLIENDKLNASEVKPSPEMSDAAMRLIGGNDKLTAILLQNATSNRKLAEAIALRDRLSIDMPAEFGEKGIRFARSAADVKARGYTEEVMAAAFTENPGQSIIRGNFSATQRDIAASAGDPAVVALRQRDFTSLVTDGSSKIQSFAAGSLQTQLLYALASEPDNKTMLALEEQIRKDNAGSPSKADTQIELLRAGVQNAKNYQSGKVNGVSHDDHKLKIGASTVYGATEQGVSLAASETKTSETSFDGDRAKNVMAHVAKQAGGAKALLAAKAAGGDEKTSEQILDLAAKMPDAQRIAIAQAALKGLDNAGKAAVRSAVYVVFDNAEKNRFDSLSKAKNLTADDAAFVLNALKSGEGEKLALAAIAKDGNASKALVGAIAKQDPAFIAAINATLGDGAAAVAEKSGVAAKDLTAPTKTTVTTTVVAPKIDPKLQDLADLMSNKFLDADKRSVVAVTSLFNNPNMTDRAMRELVNNQPDLATALVLQSLTNEPKLLKPAAEALRKQGNPGFLDRVFSNYPQGKLAYIMESLATAQQSGDQAAQALYAGQLNSFMANPDNKQAVRDMVTSVMGANPADGRSGRDAVIKTLNTTLDSRTSANPLPNYSLTGQQVLAALIETTIKADPVNAPALARDVETVIGNTPSVGGGIFPGVIIPIGHTSKPGEPEKPLNQGNVGQCGTAANPIPCPTTPTGPVTPPITPPVPPPAPTAPTPPR